jgi:hypothetical protein
VGVQGERAGKVFHHPPQRGRGAGREERHGVLQSLLVSAQQQMDTDQRFDVGAAFGTAIPEDAEQGPPALP